MSVKTKPIFTMGCDPELFLADIHGQLKASCGKIGGTKQNPQPLGIGDGFAVQEDNVAVEFNIPPAGTAREFVMSVSKAMKVIGDGVNSMYGYHLDNRASASFPKEELESPAALEFGCDPDYNAWTGDKNPKPKAEDSTLRSCGGHVHVGYAEGSVDAKRLVKFMDLFLGVPATLMDKDDRRKQLYGKSGAHRIPTKYHGVEYRVLSNFWVHDPKLTQWVWQQTSRAMDWCISPMDIDKERDAITKAIDNNDKGLAMALCHHWKLDVLNV